MAALFLIQTLVGAASQHYRAELGGFFGIDLAKLFPYNLARTFHVQLALFFVSTSFLAAGIFLAPMIAGREPRGQGRLAYILLVALAVVVFGSLIGEFAGVHGWLGSDGQPFGDQGFEYLDLGRFWQVLLVIGLFFWVAISIGGCGAAFDASTSGTCRGSSSSRRWRSRRSTRSACSPRGESFTVTDFWRFWVVHLWVEDFLELFTTVMVAYIFVLLGVVRERVALTVDLPRHHPLLGRRGDRDDAPPLLLRRARRAHGARRGVLGGRGDPAHLPHRRGLELPPARERGRSRDRRRRSRIAGR